MTLKISISGVRGIYGDTLTEDVIRKFGIAFSRLVGGGTVIVGSDTRKSSPAVKEHIFRGLRAMGKTKIIDVGYLPTPTIQIITKHYKADGAIIASASHNPKEWNGLKFVRPDGIFLTEEEGQRLISLYEQVTKEDLLKAREGRLDVETDFDAGKFHLDLIKSFVNAAAIQKANLKVAIDTCCGAGSLITKQLLEMLGVSYVQINGEMSIEACNRGLEPIPAHLGPLGEAVRSSGAAIGFAQDPDADRLAIVNEKGDPIGEDYTLCLVAEYMLQLRAAGKVSGENNLCTNLSTTRIVDDVAKKYGAQVIRTKIGEVNVSMAMKKHQSVVGGEGNGGIIIPGIGFGRDSLMGIALMCEYLATSERSVTELVSQNPRYTMYKTKIDCTSAAQVDQIVTAIKQKYAQEKLDVQDGVKVVFADGNWVHVRASNTEPIIRIIAEAETLEKAKTLAEAVKP
jgi:phosphomannomutase